MTNFTLTIKGYFSKIVYLNLKTKEQMKNYITPFAIAMISYGATAITLQQETPTALAQGAFNAHECKDEF